MFYEKEFLQHLRDNRYAKKTIRAYTYLLNHLTAFLKDHGISNVNEVTTRHLAEYTRHIERTCRSRKYYYVRVRRLMLYFRFLEDREYIFLSPFDEVTIHGSNTARCQAIDGSTIETVLSGIRTDGSLCVKGKAMIELAYSSALRPRELYNLKLTDIDYAKGLLFLQQSKKRKDRIVPVGTQALLWVKKYIKQVRRRYLKDTSETHVFISHKTGKKLTVWGVRWAVQQTLRLSGFEPIKPYALRATAATALMQNGMSVGYISTLLGHTEIRTTQIYLNVEMLELKKLFHHKHPRVVMESKRKTKEKNHEV